MNAPLSLKMEQKKEAKILHITDSHLFSSTDATLLGVNTNASFQAVLSEIEKSSDDIDLIIATGDFVQDSSQAAYEYFAQEIKKLNKPCVYIPGNHDIIPLMENVFYENKLSSEKVILLGDSWVIVLLDSHVEGEAYGLLSDDELAFLSSTLTAYSDRYALIFLHHHPILSGCKWLDNHCLKNRGQLEKVLGTFKNVKGIGWGHIHQVIERAWLNLFAFSTPSTCVQFKSQSDNFSLSGKSPGWRTMVLKENGEIETEVYRLNCHLFLPDMSQNGY